MINIWATYVSIQRCLCLQYGYFIFNYSYTCFDELAACKNITESFWTYAGLLAANTVVWIKTLFFTVFPSEQDNLWLQRSNQLQWNISSVMQNKVIFVTYSSIPIPKFESKLLKKNHIFNLLQHDWYVKRYLYRHVY